MTLPEAVLAAQAFASCALAGLIWFVQIVHYPLMSAVGADAGCAYARAHQGRTTLVVAPLMLTEALTSAWLCVSWHTRPPLDGVPVWVAWLGAGLVAALWLSTALLQVPCHARLAAGAGPDVVRRLVATNWLRTVLWTARGVLAVGMLLAA